MPAPVGERVLRLDCLKPRVVEGKRELAVADLRGRVGAAGVEISVRDVVAFDNRAAVDFIACQAKKDGEKYGE